MLKVAESTQKPGPVVATPKRRRWRRNVAVVLVLFLALVGAGAGALYWQLTRSSITIGYLSDRVAAAIEQRLPMTARVSVASTAVSYRSGKGVILRIKDIDVEIPGVATALTKELSTASNAAALINGRIDLRTVDVAGLAITIAGVPPPERAGSGADFVRRAAMMLMNRVVEADDVMRAVGLQDVAVHDADIRFAENAGRLNPSLKIGQANWLPLSPNRSRATIEVLDKSGGSWDLTVERRKTQLGNAVVNLDFDGVPAEVLAPVLADTGEGPHLTSDLTLQTRMARGPDGRFVGLRGSLSASDGQLSISGQDQINIARASVTFVLDETGDRVIIPSGEVRTLTGGLSFEGVADLSAVDRMTLVARIRGGSLPTPVGNRKSIPIIGGGGVARINFTDLGIEVDQVQLATPEGFASAIGQASIAGRSPGLSLALSMSKMPVGVARALWPPFIADKVRQWIDENVKSGTIGPGTLQIALPPDHIGLANRGKVLPRYGLIGSLPFHDAVFTPLRTFPTVRGGDGKIEFSDATAHITAEGGIMSVPGRGDVTTEGTSLVIPELGRLKPRGDLHVELSGTAAALAQISNTEPLSVAKDRGIAPDDLKGDAALTLDVNIPLYKSDFADLIPSFRLALNDFSSASPIDGRHVGKSNLVLEGSPRSYTVKGEGELDGYRVAVDLIQGSAAPDQSAVTVSLNGADRKRMGLAFGDLVTGPIQAYLMNTGDGELGEQVALDLKQARISLPFLGWEKGPGVPATASFVMDKSDAGTELTRFLLAGKGFEVRGALSIDPNGRLKKANLDRVSLRPGDQLSAEVTAKGNGYDVSVSGDMLDARGIINKVGGGQFGGNADIFPIKVKLNVKSVRGENDVLLSGVSGTMQLTTKGLDAVALRGASDGDQPFEWTLARDGNTRSLRLFANAGGSLIRFAGVYNRVAGGNMVLDYTGTVGGAGSGVLVMHDFRVINETVLRNVLDPASPRAGMVQAYQPIDNDYRFSQLRIPFEQQGWVIKINDAALRGVSIGATAEGTINLPDGNMAIRGTLIPAFGINNIAGSIPILGAILGGGRNEGLVGITYKMFGPVKEPSFVVNPISAIAPGIFRKIFEYR